MAATEKPQFTIPLMCPALESDSKSERKKEVSLSKPNYLPEMK
jgi:hypothetical protein